MLAGFVGVRLLPDMQAAKEEARRLIDWRFDAEGRVASLGELVTSVQLLVQGPSAGAPAARVEEVRARALPFFVPSAVASSTEDEALAQVALEASEFEGVVASGVVLVVSLLERGERTEALLEFEAVDRAYAEAVRVWAGGREEVAAQFVTLESTVDSVLYRGARFTGLWAVLGLLFATGRMVVLQRRVVDPSKASGTKARDSGLPDGPNAAFLARYGRVLEETATALVVVDPRTMAVVATNSRARRDLELDETELRGRPIDQLWIGDDTAEQVIREVGSGESARGVFFANQRCGDSGTRRVEVRAFGVEASPSTEVITIVHDLSERRRFEQFNERLARFAVEHGRTIQQGDLETACREITEMAAELLDVGTASVWFMEADGIRCGDLFDARSGRHDKGAFIASDEAPRYFRALRTQRTLAANNVRTHPATQELVSYLEAEGVDALLDVPVRRGGELIGVICHQCHDGPRTWRVEEKVLAGAIGDILLQAVESAEREETERRLAASERRYRSIFESAAIGIAESDRSGFVRGANGALCQMLGYTAKELDTITFESITFPEDRPASKRAVDQFLRNERDTYVGDKRYIRKDGTLMWAHIHASAVRDEDGTLASFVVIIRDRSAEKELEDQLAHAQRMDSIGRLAGGIAHDFNNVLTTILGNAEMARARLPRTSQAARQVEAIEDSARRASGLTHQLLTFARRDVVRATTVELDRLTQGSEQLLRRLIGEKIELSMSLAATGAFIEIDPQQFDQVLMNLTLNARDALPDGGTIRIRTLVVRGADLPEVDSAATAKEFVVLELSDDGAGMSDEVQELAFEPFFSTKEPGEGTGLGLATCYGIVSEAGGTIRVRSELGAGTTVSIILPRVEGVAEALLSDESTLSHGGAGLTVLVIEDAEPVRELIAGMLRDQGHVVLEAVDGLDGVDLAHSHIGPIDLLISDIVMPSLSGPEAVRRIRAKRSGLPVLFISGYTAEHGAETALGAEDTDILAKPFTPSELMARVHQLLGSSGSDSVAPAG